MPVDARRVSIAMHDFKFLVEDRRYQVPTLHLVQAKDAERARELAAKMLAASHDHLSIEVWEGETLLFTLDWRELAASRRQSSSGLSPSN
jgi:hypothetical protein